MSSFTQAAVPPLASALLQVQLSCRFAVVAQPSLRACPLVSCADDILVVAVGEQPATFGVKGVEEHCYFMKARPLAVKWQLAPAAMVHFAQQFMLPTLQACPPRHSARPKCTQFQTLRHLPPLLLVFASAFTQEIPDSVGLRQRIQQQFELAALPGTKEADMRRALHFVVVGGGPTGVLLALLAALLSV